MSAVRGHKIGPAQDGLGLGLYIAREIARAHGGEIHVHFDERETIFTVCLPRSCPPVCRQTFRTLRLPTGALSRG